MKNKISASILNADFSCLNGDIQSVINHIDEIHCDVMDGHFVHNISFGAPLVQAVRSAFPQAVIDTHLMISDPEQYREDFIKAGSDILVFHYEATPHAYITLKRIKEAGIRAGISVTPATEISLLEPLAPFLDRVLIMTVEPGFGGQQFIPEMLPKIRKARALFGEIDIQVDGGINEKTLPEALNAGANVFVVGSYLFNSDDKSERAARLRSLLD